MQISCYTFFMEQITLKNEQFTATISLKGAELTSLRSSDGTQYVFEGPESVWKYHAPVLFPHVGRIADGFYTWKGKEYHLVNNGMSRDLMHTLTAQTQTSADFLLTESEETADKFPWKFRLETHYELTQNGLIFTTRVTNTDSEEMLFSLGSHTAFCCPRNTDHTWEHKSALLTLSPNESFTADQSITIER